MSYSRTITFRFEVCGEGLETDGWWEASDGTKCIEVAETRCNGQEDTHMSGMLSMNGDLWEWNEEEGGRKLFDEYASESFSDAILAYINENPPPKAE